jgi:xylose isomerase
MLEDGKLEEARAARYAGWDDPANKDLLSGTLDDLHARVTEGGLDPQPVSGRQERLENLVNRYL